MAPGMLKAFRLIELAQLRMGGEEREKGFRRLEPG
jgi:hypothetical protein